MRATGGAAAIYHTVHVICTQTPKVQGLDTARSRCPGTTLHLEPEFDEGAKWHSSIQIADRLDYTLFSDECGKADESMKQAGRGWCQA